MGSLHAVLGEILSARDTSLNQTDVPASRSDRYRKGVSWPAACGGPLAHWVALATPLGSVFHSLLAFQVSWGSPAASTAPLEGFRQPPILSRELSCSPLKDPRGCLALPSKARGPARAWVCPLPAGSLFLPQAVRVRLFCYPQPGLPWVFAEVPRQQGLSGAWAGTSTLGTLTQMEALRKGRPGEIGGPRSVGTASTPTSDARSKPSDLEPGSSPCPGPALFLPSSAHLWGPVSLPITDREATSLHGPATLTPAHPPLQQLSHRLLCSNRPAPCGLRPGCSLHSELFPTEPLPPQASASLPLRVALSSFKL